MVSRFSWAKNIVKAPQKSTAKKEKDVKVVEEAKQVPSSSADHILTDKLTTEKYLKKNGIKFQTVEHIAVFTMQEMDENTKFSGAYAKTEFAKNLFYQDKKKKD